MESYLAPLLAKSFDRAEARDANEAIGRARRQVGEQARSFEVAVPETADAGWLEKALVPKMVYHLESLGIRPPEYGGIFASLFVGEKLWFVRMKDLMEFAGAQLKLSGEQLYAKWGTGEARRAVDLHENKRPQKSGGPPLALPSGKEK